MNQRQWTGVSDASATTLKRIKQINISLVAAPTILATAVGFIVDLPIVLGLLGFVISLSFVVFLMRSIESSISSRLKLETASLTDHARLINVVDGLCVVSGDRRPPLFVVQEPFPVALAIAAPRQQGIVVVSDGLLVQMDRVELEAVMAHVLWRLRNGDIGFTCYLISLKTMLGKIGVGGIANWLIKKLSEDKILLWADISACQATRYPPALISALDKCGQARLPRIDPIVRPLMFVDPRITDRITPDHDTIATSQVPKVESGPAGVQERIAVLKEI